MSNQSEENDEVVDLELIEEKKFEEKKFIKNTDEVSDPRRAPSKKNVSKHQMIRGTNISKYEKKKELLSDKEDKNKYQSSSLNSKVIRTSNPSQNIKTKKDLYVPNNLGSNYKILLNNTVIFDSSSKIIIVFNKDFITINGKNYFYEKITFILN